MAIDASIALGIKPIQIENPLNNMVKFANIRNDMQTNQMNQLTMAEAARKQGQAAQYRNALSNLGDPSSEGYEERRAQAYYNNADPAGYQAIRTSELANQKMQGEIQVQKEELAARVSRDLSRSSTNANVTAWFEESMDSHVFKPQEKVAITNEYGKIMAIPEGPERAAYLRSKGQSAAEAKPSTLQQDAGGNANIYSVSSNTAEPPMLVSSTEKTLNPEQQSKMPSGQAKLQKEYTEAEAGIKALLAKANSAKTEPERAQALADAKALSASNSLRGEEITRLQQSTQPLDAKDRRIRDYNQAIKDGRSPNDQDMKDLRLQIIYDRTHANQIRPPIDPRVVTHVTVKEDGTLVNQNALGEVVSTIKEGGKPSAQYSKAKEQAKTLNRNVDIAIKQIGDAIKPGGLLDRSTGSGFGRGVDIAANFVGKSTSGARAAATLAPIADLAVKLVTRFEGNQSNADVVDYKTAAGQLADPTLPIETRRDAAVKVMEIMKRRKGQFITPEMAAQGEVPAGGIAPPAGFVAD